MEGVVKLLEPDNNALPPVDAAYQSITFPAELADKETVPVLHLLPFVPAGADGTAFTVAVTTVLEEDMQPVVVFLASA